jgi:hypothetical protein
MMVKRFSTSNDPLEDPTRPQLLPASEGFDQLLPASEGFDIDPEKACHSSSPQDHQANPFRPSLKKRTKGKPWWM